jgi:hypothetical protein
MVALVVLALALEAGVAPVVIALVSALLLIVVALVARAPAKALEA